MSERKTWSSYEEFKETIQPDFIKRPGYIVMESPSLFGDIKYILNYINQLKKNLEEAEFIYEKNKGNWDKDSLDRMLIKVSGVSHASEVLFFYFPDLAKNQEAKDLIYEKKELLENWDYNTQTTHRADYAFNAYIGAAKELSRKLDDIIKENENFLLDEVNELPEDLQQDFRVARDLFSVGMEESGVFASLRGLEGVLREVSKRLGLEIQKKKKQEALSDQDLAVIIDKLYEIKWKDNNETILSQPNATFIHFLRQLRNKTAHSDETLKTFHSWREAASFSARTAKSIWEASNEGTREVKTQVVYP